MVVRFLPVLTTQSPIFWFCSTVMAVSTSTASRSPEISVEEIGDHFISVAPGARSSVTTGIWPLTKTSHCNRFLISLPQFFGPTGHRGYQANSSHSRYRVEAHAPTQLQHVSGSPASRVPCQTT